jgi:hypothetical protein
VQAEHRDASQCGAVRPRGNEKILPAPDTWSGFPRLGPEDPSMRAEFVPAFIFKNIRARDSRAGGGCPMGP